MMRRPIPTVAALVALTRLATSMCYNPNGTQVFNWGADSIYQPCSKDSSDPLSNICCALNRANPSGGSIDNGFTADTCLPSGLCQNILTDESGNKIYSYWRDYCTSTEWESGKCLKVCTGDGQHSDDGTAPLTPCGDTATATKWCCGTNNTACCSSSDPAQEMQIPVSLGGSITSATLTSASSSSTAAATSTSTSSPSANNNAPSSKDTTNAGLSTGAKAGIGAGVAVGGVLAISVAVVLALSARRRKHTGHANPYELSEHKTYSEVPGTPAGTPGPPPGYSTAGGNGYFGPSEVEGHGIAEMGTDGGRAEKYKHGGPEPVELA